MTTPLRIIAAVLMSAAAALAAPIITSITPASGPAAGGITITITINGSGFGLSPTVTLAGNPVITSSATDIQIKFTLPPGSGTPIVVVDNAGETAQTTFSYDPPPPLPPVILSIAPERGLASETTSVVITGQNFGFSPSVTFGGVSAPILISTATTLTVTKPVDSGGDKLVVVVSGGQPSNVKLFRSVTLTSLPSYYVDLIAEQVVPAPLGSYADLANLTAPKLAPAGYYAPVIGMRQAIPCPPGTFSDVQGATAPTPAPAGRFVANAGSTSAQPSPAGKYTPLPGMSDAIPSSPGHFVDQTGATAQSPAPPGSFVANAGATAVTPAARGTYAPVSGMVAAIPSTPGHFVSSIGASEQTPAAPGQFVANASASSPSNAPMGHYTPVSGMAAALPASPGYFVNSQGAATQQPAPVGQFVATSGATSAFPAPPGYYAPITSLRAAIPAPEGTYVPTSGASAALPVPPGFATTGPAASSITPIPQIQLTAYTLGPTGTQSLSFETVASQNYGMFYTENLIDYILLESVAGTGGIVTRAFSPLVSTTSKRFYIVAPVE